MKRKQSTRDNCTICRRNNTGSVGHSAQFCAYKGGPFEGKFKAAVAAARAEKKRSRQLQQPRQVASAAKPPQLTATAASTSATDPLPHALLNFFNENIETDEEGEHDLAKQQPLGFIANYLTKQDIYHDKRESDTNEELRMVKQRLDFLTEKSIEQTATLTTTTATITKLQAALTAATTTISVLSRSVQQLQPVNRVVPDDYRYHNYR